MLKGNAPNQNLQVANNVLDLNVSKMRMRLNNLFNGDPILGNICISCRLMSYVGAFNCVVLRSVKSVQLVETLSLLLTGYFVECPNLGETVNNFLNENSQEVFAEVKPEMAKQVGELVIKVMNDALGALPAEKFVSSRTRS